MMNDEIGEAAGVVWTLLNAKGETSESRRRKESKEGGRGGEEVGEGRSRGRGGKNGRDGPGGWEGGKEQYSESRGCPENGTICDGAEGSQPGPEPGGQSRAGAGHRAGWCGCGLRGSQFGAWACHPGATDCHAGTALQFRGRQC